MGREFKILYCLCYLNQQQQHHFQFGATALRTRMQNPIRTAPIHDNIEPNSIRVDIWQNCGIELTTKNENACNEVQDIQAQTLLPAAAARSDCTQGADDHAFDGSQILHGRVQEESGSNADCCHLQWSDSDHYLPVCDCDTISECTQRHTKCILLVSVAIVCIIVILPISLAWITPKGHAGPTAIEGNCNNHTRCHVTATCNVVSSSSYTCSCPSWLVGSGFDDDPCICRSAVFKTPDFVRSRCVTSVSHFDMAGLLCFIFGMTLFLIFIIITIALQQGACAFVLFAVWCMLVAAAAEGDFTENVDHLCGLSSFDADVCGRGRFCVNNACSTCPYPDLQSWDDISGKCIYGKAGNCTAHSCDSLPGSVCVPKQNLFVQYHACVKSSSSILTAPGVTALAFAVFMAMIS